MPTVNQRLRDRSVSHQIYLQRYSTGVVNRVLKFLKDVIASIEKQLEKIDAEAARAQDLRATLERIQTINRDSFARLEDGLRKELRELAVYEADFTAEMVRDALTVDVEFDAPLRSMVTKIALSEPFEGKLFSEWLGTLSKATFQKIEKLVKIGMAEGKTIDEIVRDIVGTKDMKYRDGVLHTSHNEAEAIVRTSVNDVANKAREQVWKENADIIKGVQWVSTLDGRTTIICQHRDGMVFPVNQGPRPPAHFNCRSTTVPVLKSAEEMGIKNVSPATRASMNGQVAATETYETWFLKQPATFQREVLGPTRYALWKDGKVPIGRFVDASGHTYTIAELRKRESSAFKRAHLV